jgi:uncharacterized RDD family membrane protein YckC
MIAGVVDAAVVVALVLAGYLGVNGLRFLLHPRQFHFTEASPLLGTTTALTVLVVYLAATWSITGRSYGCQVMGLRVVSRQGRRLQPHVALLRAILCTLFPIGLLFCAGGRRHRSLQDLILRTSVIYDWRPRQFGADDRS